MRKLFFILAVVIIAFTQQCDKPTDTILEIDFLGIPTNPGDLKSVPDCWDVPADYAEIVINGIHYKRDIFYLQGKTYTQSIKLNEGIYTLEGFALFFDQNNNDPSDDLPIAAAPKTNGAYAEWVSQALDFEFVVEGFGKVEIPIEVLCVGDKDVYKNFGFDWFVINEGSIRRQCFFGDLCIFDPDDYTGSAYEDQGTGLATDMPAIFKIDLYRNDEFVNTYENMDWLGEEDPLCISYLDRKNFEEKFDFELHVLVRYGKEGNSGHNHFKYEHIHTWTVWDEEEIYQGNNNDDVINFVTGQCSSNADFYFPYYIDLPKDCKSTIDDFVNTSPFTIGDLGFLYVDVSSIPDGHEFYEDTWLAWSIDHNTDHQIGDMKNMNIYNSMYTDHFPEFVKPERWERVNWIMNHLEDYPGYEWSDIQGAFWLLDGWGGTGQYGVPDLADLTHARQMHDDAVANAAGFIPTKWDKVAIILVPVGSQPAQQAVDIQVIFFELGL